MDVIKPPRGFCDALRCICCKRSVKRITAYKIELLP